MRTRAQGSSLPVATSPPSNRGRKRTSVGATHETNNNSSLCEAQDDSGTIVVASTTTTPTKPAKRVRFSDPGPPLFQDDALSTGLTPHIRRFAITSPTTVSRRTAWSRASRRASLPATLSQPSNTLLTVQELQFKPLKQLLGDRTRRRLRRNHLSEEVNDFESHQKREERMRHELAELVELREQAQRREDTVKELTLELELQRQLGIEVNSEEEDRVRALKAEVEALRDEVSNHPSSSEYADPLDDDDLLALEDDSSTKHLVQESIEITATDAARVNNERAPRYSISQEESDAKTALTLVSTELQTLGFSGTNAEEVISSIRSAFRQTRLDLEYLLPGETPGGFENGALLPFTISHIRNLLHQVKDASATLKAHQATESALRGQFNDALRRLARLDAAKQQLDLDYHGLRKRANARDVRITDLEAECSTHAASTQKLQTALQSYRDEVAGLESLLTTLEKDKVMAEDSLTLQLQEKQTVIRTLQEEVQHRAEDAEDAVDRADELQRALARTERELEDAKALLASQASGAGRVVADIVGCFGRAGEEAEGLAEKFLGGLEVEGEKLSQIRWRSNGRARDSGVALSSDGIEEE